MFKNYLKILIRNMHRNKGYTVINITGLAAGLVCCRRVTPTRILC